MYFYIKSNCEEFLVVIFSTVIQKSSFTSGTFRVYRT